MVGQAADGPEEAEAGQAVVEVLVALAEEVAVAVAPVVVGKN